MPCPSPYSSAAVPGEVIPSAPMPERAQPELPMPMPPVPVQPMPEPSPLPSNPRDGIQPQSYEVPLSVGRSDLAPAGPSAESSSRRRSIEASYPLDGLRWAPTDSP
jgi:hypothetical protein